MTELPNAGIQGWYPWPVTTYAGVSRAVSSLLFPLSKGLAAWLSIGAWSRTASRAATPWNAAIRMYA